MTKPRANRLGMYADVRAVADRALELGGGSFQCETHGMAVHWRQRFYKFRKLFAETLGPKAESPYDMLVLGRVLPGETLVQIKIRQQQGVFVAPDGVALPDEVDELEAAAARLVAQLGGNDDV